MIDISIDDIYQDLMTKLVGSLIEAVFVENYEIQISRFDFTHVHVYFCRVSFLTTLDIYKNYFEGRNSVNLGCV